MKQLMFSTVYPAYHPSKGDPTDFVAKILESQNMDMVLQWLETQPGIVQRTVETYMSTELTPKIHTIRAGQRWQAGDVFAPKIWSDKPYRSKTIQFAPPITITHTYDFEFTGESFLLCGNTVKDEDHRILIANNDGLYLEDFEAWFNKPFKGQIICWQHVGTYDYIKNL